MNARHTLLAMFALTSLATSAFAQDWTSEATYTKTVTTTYYKPVYHPVVVGYTPTYAAGPATCDVPAAQPVVPAPPAGPKVWVHEKVYVQGHPLRNLFTAITP